MRQCADIVKKVSLELGGNAPFIVFDDADLDAAVDGVMASKFRNAGQTCVCTNRILVQNTVRDAFVEKMSAAVGNLKVGDGFAEGITTGPLINSKAVEKVNRLVENALANGAELGKNDATKPQGENFCSPTMLTDVTSDMEIANDTPFGLAAYFYARDISLVWRVAEQLEYGMVGINEGIISTEVALFGGVKESGIGREGSKYGIDDFVVIKYICVGGIQAE